MAEPRRYQFAPLEQRGLVAGLRPPQMVALGAGLLFAVAALRASNTSSGIAAAVVAVGAGAGVAFLRIGGRPLDEWAPVVARFAAVRRRVATRPGAFVGPRALQGVTVHDVAHRSGEPMAVVTDRRSGLSVAVVRVRGSAFALLDRAEKERRLSAWGSILGALAREGGPVRRLQWIERTVGGDSEALRRHLDSHARMSASSPARRAYADLVDGAGPLTEEHECFVSVAVRAGTDPAWLSREIRLLEGQLANAEIDVSGVLSGRELAGVIRTAYDPSSRPALARRAGDHPDLAGSSLEAAWPVRSEVDWRWLRTDDAYHASFWVAEWPRVEVGPDFLTPLLLQVGGRRSVSLVMSPRSVAEGTREAESARTAMAADDELRRRAGFLGTARRRKEAEGVLQRERELADGHAAYRFSGFVTVTAEDVDSLEQACREVVQGAQQARLDLRRLNGLHDVAFTWTLPLARGLR